MNMLLRFPESLAISMLTNWLHLTDVVKVDSAHCNHTSRAKFLSLAYREETVYKNVSYHQGDTDTYFDTVVRRLNWLHFKGAVLSELNLLQITAYEVEVHHTCLQVLQRAGPALLRINLNGMCASSENMTELIAAVGEHCPNITVVGINSCSLGDGQLGPLLRHCKHIVNLYIRHVKSSLAPFAGEICANLKTLEIVWTAITDVDFITFIDACSALTSFSVDGCRQLTDAGVIHMIHHCPQLQHIRLGGEMGLSSDVIVQLAINCRNLTALRTYSAYNDETLQTLAQYCPQLTSLIVDLCEGITDTSVVMLAENCTRLHTLHLTGANITDASLFALADLCPELVTLNLRDCSSITSVSLRALCAKCANIRKITASFSKVRGITAALSSKLGGVLLSDAFY